MGCGAHRLERGEGWEAWADELGEKCFASAKTHIMSPKAPGRVLSLTTKS